MPCGNRKCLDFDVFSDGSVNSSHWKERFSCFSFCLQTLKSAVVLDSSGYWWVGAGVFVGAFILGHPV